jgi:hypothetical protein
VLSEGQVRPIHKLAPKADHAGPTLAGEKQKGKGEPGLSSYRMITRTFCGHVKRRRRLPSRNRDDDVRKPALAVRTPSLLSEKGTCEIITPPVAVPQDRLNDGRRQQGQPQDAFPLDLAQRENEISVVVSI